jgi:hypothetical protein
MTFLATEALDFGHGQAFHAETGQSLAHLVEFERFDDRCDELHGTPRFALRLAMVDRFSCGVLPQLAAILSR